MKKYRLCFEDEEEIFYASHVEVKEGFLIIYEPIGKSGGYRVKEYIKPLEGTLIEILYED